MIPSTLRLARLRRGALALIALLVTTGTPSTRAHDEIPGAAPGRPVALTGGTIHPITSGSFVGTLVLDDGRIVAIGPHVEVPGGALKVDVTGKHVYPGLFDAFTSIGLVEINAVRATRDTNETGAVNPNVKAWVAVNPDSETIPVTRSNGVLLAVTAPSGGLISGQAGVLQLDGWTWEDMTVRPAAGLVVSWPRMAPSGDWWVEGAEREALARRDEELARLGELFDQALVYRAARGRPGSEQRLDARLESLLPTLDRAMPLIVRADRAADIQAAVAFARERSLRLIVHGGYDAEACAALLRRHDVPVIIDGVYRLPLRRSDPYDAAYTLPERLRRAGVRFAISCGGRFAASNLRNLPYHAATAVAFGLPHEEALRAVTIQPARILGVDDRVGSLEVGKDGTLIVTDGDPLETSTHVERAWISGRPVDLNDRHERLWRKYHEKYRRRGAR